MFRYSLLRDADITNADVISIASGSVSTAEPTVWSPPTLTHLDYSQQEQYLSSSTNGMYFLRTRAEILEADPLRRCCVSLWLLGSVLESE